MIYRKENQDCPGPAGAFEPRINTIATRCSGRNSGVVWRLTARVRQPNHAGSKLILSRVPVARATLSSVRVDGWIRPLSRRATTDCVVPIRSASSAWVSSARLRASISVRDYGNSASSRS